MTPLLDLPAVRQQVHLLSVDDYHRMGELGVFHEDVELLRGLVVKKMPKSPLHEFVAEKLSDLLRAQAPQDFRVRVERPLTLASSEPEPDLSLVRGRPEDWLDAHPTTAQLVVEIAVSSESIDRSKAAIYAHAGIPEYWIVLPDAGAVEVFRDPALDGYRTRISVSKGETLISSALPSIRFDPSEILPKR